MALIPAKVWRSAAKWKPALDLLIAQATAESARDKVVAMTTYYDASMYDDAWALWGWHMMHSDRPAHWRQCGWEDGCKCIATIKDRYDEEMQFRRDPEAGQFGETAHTGERLYTTGRDGKVNGTF
jgi:hypothetical protein